MKSFFDTSVLVASCEATHPHFIQASAAVERIVGGVEEGFIGLHSLAETYSSLTKLPILPRIHPVEAARLIAESILPYFKTVPLVQEDYTGALTRLSSGGWPGGAIYDALLLRCAEKCKADRIYTFNVSHFRLLASQEQTGKITVPA